MKQDAKVMAMIYVDSVDNARALLRRQTGVLSP